MKSSNGSVPSLGYCKCGAAVHAHGFRNRISIDEYRLSGLCQRCQNELFLSTCDEDPGVSYSLRLGALAALRTDGSALAELCVFPFVLAGASVPRIAWEARFLMRAGHRFYPVDVSHDLSPVETVLHGHQVGLAEFQSFAAATLGERLGHLDVVVVLDGETLAAVSALCPFSSEVSYVSLCDGVPWVAAFGRELRPLDTWSLRGRASGSALHMCALMAYVLLWRGSGGRPLDHLFGSSSGIEHRSKGALDDGGAS